MTLRSTWTNFMTGLGFLGRGFKVYGKNPGLLFLGMIPAVISFVLLGTAWIFLILNISDLAEYATGYADDWSSFWRGLMRFGAAVAIVAVAAFLSVLTYTALTLLIGEPFYELISERVEDGLGGTPGATNLPWYRTLWPNAVDSVRLLLLGVLIAIPLFALGFIPIVGQTVVPVLDVLVGGWLLAVELTGVPFNRRGMRLKERRVLLRANRPLALGLGVPVFLLVLIPLAAIVVIPAAIAGSTLMTRKLLHQ